jgi:hypothetical protein
MCEVQLRAACYKNCSRVQLAPSCHSIELESEQEPLDEYSHYAPCPSYGSKGAAIMAALSEHS